MGRYMVEMLLAIYYASRNLILMGLDLCSYYGA